MTWYEILEVLAQIEAKDEAAVLVGDLNKAVGDIIPKNNPKVSVGGAMVRELIETGKYALANASSKVIGGPNTRYQPGAYLDITKRSCLDLCIVSKSLEKYIETVVIDEELNFTPGYAVGNKVRYSDHFSLLIRFKGLPLRRGHVNTKHPEAIWNTRKKGGWEKFTKLTTDNRKFREIAASAETETVDSTENKFNKELLKIKFSSFGKVKHIDKKQTSNKINEIRREKEKLVAENKITNEAEIEKLDAKLLETLKEEQKVNMERDLTHLKRLENSKGNAARVFRLKSDIVGGKKNPQEPTAVKDPVTGEIVTDPTKIKNIVISFVKQLLTNRLPSIGYENDLYVKRLLHETRMSERLEADIEYLSMDMFNNSLKELWRKKGKKYEFLVKGGNDMKRALFCLFYEVWRQETIPTNWKNTKVVQIWKGKGDFRD